MFQTKFVETLQICFGLNNFFFENLAFCEIMWTNIVERRRSQMIIWCMRIAWWIPKATNTQLHYVMLISFPLKQWLQNVPHFYVTITLPVFSFILLPIPDRFSGPPNILCNKYLDYSWRGVTEWNVLQLLPKFKNATMYTGAHTTSVCVTWLCKCWRPSEIVH